MPRSTVDDDSLIQQYIAAVPRIRRAVAAVVTVLTEVLAAHSLPATLTSRVKDVDSFRVKLATKTEYTDPWRQITDKGGVRAMVFRGSQVDDIFEAIREDGRLEVVTVTDKRGIYAENELGYSGLHLDLMAPAESGDGDPVGVELQIRTYAQHAWSEVSHKLLYKPQNELDSDDRRAIWRLVALVEVFDGEVSRVMAQLPDYGAGTAAIPDVFIAQYARFENNAGEPRLTRQVSEVLLSVLPAKERPAYSEELHAWVTSEFSRLRQLYDDYGSRSSMVNVSDFLMWSQPESVGILEALAHRPWRLLEAWRGASLPDRWLQPLAAVGTDLDLGLE